VTHLRKVMLEELQRRNFSSETIRGYIGAVERLARYFGKPPDQLGPEHIRQWQVHLLHERKLAVGTVVNHVAGLRFFFRRVSFQRPNFGQLLSNRERIRRSHPNIRVRPVNYPSLPQSKSGIHFP